MSETTVNLPDDLRVRLRRVAESTGTSEAELIVRGVSLLLATTTDATELPPLPVFHSGRSRTSEELSDALYKQLKERTARR